MTDSEQRELVKTAERQIASILADLEKRTGCYIDGLAVHNVEVTHMLSRAPEYARRVAVDLRRQPGSHWET